MGNPKLGPPLLQVSSPMLAGHRPIMSLSGCVLSCDAVPEPSSHSSGPFLQPPALTPDIIPAAPVMTYSPLISLMTLISGFQLQSRGAEKKQHKRPAEHKLQSFYYRVNI